MVTTFSQILLWITVLYFKALPCVSRGRSRVRVGRKMSYSGDGTSYGSGGSYSGTDSETRDKRGAYVFLYVLMEIVCFVAVVGLRYFFKD